METSGANYILDQKKLRFHLTLIVLSFLMSAGISLTKTGLFFSEAQINLFILLVIQLELFILIGVRVFRGLKLAATRKELTKIVLTRFLIFIVICFITALVVDMLLIYILNLVHGFNNAGFFRKFMHNEFREWCKGTIGGLLFGSALFIFIQWQDALKREQKLREENLIFLNETLKNQINPHFLFNSLNTISSLIATHPDTAERFISRLSSIYRYILENSPKDKVPLQLELAFIRDYFDLHKVRDEEKILLMINAPEEDKFEIIPVSLQILIENAIKHNIATRGNPLIISIFIEDQRVVVKNNLQKMSTQIKSTGIGLKNLAERARLITGNDLIIEETESYFIVKVPLIK